MLWPAAPAEGSRPEVSDADLERLYDYPPELTRPWVQVNFVSSADGAAAVAGTSEGLSHPADKKIFALGRDLADVVLVGAGTAAAEGYSGLKPRAKRSERRRRLGLAELPPLAIVTDRCSIPPSAPAFTDTVVAPLVFTAASAPERNVGNLRDAGAEVVVTGDEHVSLPEVLRELDSRGLRRVDCEGGPMLLAGMLAEDLVDQLCLTVAPMLAGPGAGRIVSGPLGEASHELTLESVLHADGFLMLRYRRASLT